MALFFFKYQDDNGGSRVLQKRWTSFAKAQLVCQQGEELQFNKLQDIVKLPPADNESPDSTLFYGVFTSQWCQSFRSNSPSWHIFSVLNGHVINV